MLLMAKNLSSRGRQLSLINLHDKAAGFGVLWDLMGNNETNTGTDSFICESMA